jgi:ABC-2 type transport system permease protein
MINIDPYKIWVIMEKEFEEILKNKIILFTLIGVPALFTIISLALILSVIYLPESLEQGEMDMYISILPGSEGMTAQEALVTFFSRAILPFFMLMPAMLPMMIASYSIIGEKKNRTLEPLLASPVSVFDILISKTLSSLLPALITTYVAAGFFALIVTLVTYPIVNKILLLDTMWLIGLFMLGPLLSFMGILFTIIVSSRVDDPRTAQQVSVLIILPLMGLFVSQMAGLLLIDTRIIIILTIVAFLINIMVLIVGNKMFNREEILTRWT